VPGSAAKILDQLNIALDQRTFAHMSKDFAIKNFIISQPPTPIFHKVEDVS
jgi:methionyl-tRNA synthetase